MTDSTGVQTPEKGGPEGIVDRGGEITPTGLTLPEHLGRKDWEAIGSTLVATYHWLPWAIGDWLNFGERVYGETYVQAAAITGKAIKTLYNYRWLSDRVAPEVRTESLTPKHHEVVAGLPPDKQRKYLELGASRQAEADKHTEHYTVQQFSDDVKRAEQDEDRAVVVVSMTCPDCGGRKVCSRCHGNGEVPLEGQ